MSATFRQLHIRIEWKPIPGTKGERGVYEVQVHNLRLPHWWDKPWKLFRVERPQFQSSIDEMRWAIDELHTRLHQGRLGHVKDLEEAAWRLVG
jgi:hypothetical protein